MSGEFYPGIGGVDADGMFETTEGTVQGNPHYENFEVDTTILPSQLYYGSDYVRAETLNQYDWMPINGDVSGTASFAAAFHLVEDPPFNQHYYQWGIWSAGMGGTFTNKPSNTWNAVAGGPNRDSYGNFTGYSLCRLIGTSWSGDNTLSATFEEIDLDKFLPGHSILCDAYGDILGTWAYDDVSATSGTWQAVTAGVYNDTSLNFGGDITGKFGSYDSINKTLDLNQGSISALFGGTGSLWTDDPAPEITVIGEYLGSGSNKIWGMDYFKGQTDGKTVADGGGAVLGFIGGLKLGNTLKALVSALYVRPIGDGYYRAGYIISTDTGLTGEFYPGIGAAGAEGMFEASGQLDSDEGIVIGPGSVTPADLYNYDENLESDHIKKGTDTNIGVVRLADDEGATVFSGTLSAETLNIRGHDLVIWRCAAGGAYNSLPDSEWSADMGGWSVDSETPAGENSYWMGTISSDVAWPAKADTAFSATVEGWNLNSENLEEVHGRLLGYYGSGTWQAYSAGVNVNQYDLTSSGRLIAQGWDTGGVGASFDFAGRIGLIGEIWSSEPSPAFVSMGEFNPGGNAQFAWLSQKASPENNPENNPVKGFFYSGHYETNSAPVYYYTTYDDGSGVGDGKGAFVGLVAGVGGAMGGEDNKLRGLAYAIYIDPLRNTGVLYCNDLNGYYTVLDDATLDGMYRLDGTLAKDFDEHLCGTTTIAPDELYENLSLDSLTAITGRGGFGTGGASGNIITNGGSGTMMAIEDQGWGVWNMVTSGTWEHPSTPPDTWRMDGITGAVSPIENSCSGGSWYGAMTGTRWSGQEIRGRVNAIWIQLSGEVGTGRRVLEGILLKGVTFGNYIDVDTGPDTWRAASAGTGYSFSTNLLTTPNLNQLDQNIIAMWNAANVDVPITVVHSAVMGGGNSFMSNVTMDMRFYGVAGGNGIWAALLNGYFTSPPPDPANWTVNLTNNTDTYTTSATLQGTKWNGGQWEANVVNGTSTNPSVGTFSGQAAGSYTGTSSGTFEGVGTGTYQKPA
jgi:hypothetical protein